MMMARNRHQKPAWWTAPVAATPSRSFCEYAFLQLPQTMRLPNRANSSGGVGLPHSEQ